MQKLVTSNRRIYFLQRFCRIIQLVKVFLEYLWYFNELILLNIKLMEISGIRIDFDEITCTLIRS